MPWTVRVGGRSFEASAERSLGPTPVRKAGLRGGAYRSGTEAEILECTVRDPAVLPLLTRAMLGPSADFEEIVAESPGGRRVRTHLASYVEKSGAVLLRLVVDG